MSGCASPTRYCYSVYGVRVTSDFPFEFPSDGEENGGSVPLAHVDFVEGTDRDFAPFAPPDQSDTGFLCQPLHGGPTYLRFFLRRFLCHVPPSTKERSGKFHQAPYALRPSGSL